MKPESNLNRVRVILADDHTIFTEGLGALIREEVDLVGIANDGQQLVELAVELKPDIVVTDISMPLLNGLDAIRLLKKKGIKSKIIILTMHGEASLVAETFHEGASGYLLKQTASTELLTAISEVWQGREFISSQLRGDFVTLRSKTEKAAKTEAESPLTPRQRQILQLTAEGKSMKQIAFHLGISTKTVESHKYALMQILGLSSNAELVRYAIKSHLV
jgi:DNA-binding NarL/FixJ family response regulator